MLISAEGTGKSQLEPSQRAWEMLQCGHIVLCQENVLPKQTGVLEQCRKGETLLCFTIFLGVSFYWSPKATNISTYISLFTVGFPVNYTSEFQKHFEATIRQSSFLSIWCPRFFLYLMFLWNIFIHTLKFIWKPCKTIHPSTSFAIHVNSFIYIIAVSFSSYRCQHFHLCCCQYFRYLRV